MQEACKNMKQCYVHHAKNFKFHSFFNDNIFPLALLMMMIFFFSLMLTVLHQYLYPIKMPMVERLVEYFVNIALGFTSISLLTFSLEVEGLGSGLGTKNSEVFLVMRVLWNLGSFLFTTAFHLYIVCFTFR